MASATGCGSSDIAGDMPAAYLAARSRSPPRRCRRRSGAPAPRRKPWAVRSSSLRPRRAAGNDRLGASRGHDASPAGSSRHATSRRSQSRMARRSRSAAKPRRHRRAGAGACGGQFIARLHATPTLAVYDELLGSDLARAVQARLTSRAWRLRCRQPATPRPSSRACRPSRTPYLAAGTDAARSRSANKDAASAFRRSRLPGR